MVGTWIASRAISGQQSNSTLAFSVDFSILVEVAWLVYQYASNDFDVVVMFLNLFRCEMLRNVERIHFHGHGVLWPSSKETFLWNSNVIGIRKVTKIALSETHVMSEDMGIITKI